jgi:hypothetical protein
MTHTSWHWQRAAPSLLWIVAIGGPAVVACLLPPLLAHMTAGARWTWIGLAAAFAVMALAASRNQLRVRDTELRQRVVLRSRAIDLDRLAGVRVWRGAGCLVSTRFSTHSWLMLPLPYAPARHDGSRSASGS